MASGRFGGVGGNPEVVADRRDFPGDLSSHNRRSDSLAPRMASTELARAHAFGRFPTQFVDLFFFLHQEGSGPH